MSTKISVYKDRYGKEPIENITLLEYIGRISEGHYAAVTNATRQAYDLFGYGPDYDEAKELAVSITPSACFEGVRQKAAPHTHSGYLLMDIDGKDNDPRHIQAFLDRVESDPYVLVSHRSIGGQGLAIILSIPPDSDTHLSYFLAASDYLKRTYSLVADPSTKDVSRLRFVSHDPDLYHNPDAPQLGEEFLGEYLSEEDALRVRSIRQYLVNPMSTKVSGGHTISRERILEVVREISPTLAGVSDYDLWLKTGFAIAGHYGEDGLEIFMALWEDWFKAQGDNEQYKRADAEKKYASECVAKNSGRLGLSVIFELATEAGIRIYEQTKQKEDPYEDRGLSPEQVLGEIRQQISDKTNDKGNWVPPTKDDAFFYIERYMRSLGIRYNELTKTPELDGEPWTDDKEKELLVTLKQNIRPSVVFLSDIQTLLPAVWEPYHPIKEFLAEVGNTPSRGLIDELLDCFVLRVDDPEDEQHIKWLIRKWLCGFPAVAFGEAPELVLAISGRRRAGKTSFFRNLLPERMRAYHGEGTFIDKYESVFEASVRMQGSWLFVDDELANMTHHDWERFKAVASSKEQTGVRKYDKYNSRVKRTAVLGGTTNNPAFLSDPTGNRRMIPAYVHEIKYHKFLAIDKEKLFGEIFREYTADPVNSWVLTTEETDRIDSISDKKRFKFDDELLVDDCFRRVDSASDRDKVYCLTVSKITAVVNHMSTNTKKYGISQIKGVLEMRDFSYKSSMRTVDGGQVTRSWMVEIISDDVERIFNQLGWSLEQFRVRSPHDHSQYEDNQTPSGNDPFSAE